MRDAQPTWPQTMLICAFGAAFCLLGYLLSRMRGSWGPAAWAVLALLVLCGMGFLATVFLFYLRPQYGPKAFPLFLLMLLGHVMIVAVLWKIGAPG